MSQQNVEAVRASVEEFAGTAAPGRASVGVGGEAGSIEGTLAKMSRIWAPEIEWDASDIGIPDISGVYRGEAAVRRFWEQWFSAWETVDFDYELVDAGDQVVMLLDQKMRGLHTGIEVPLGKYAQVATFNQDGLMVRCKIYPSQARALEEAGLPELAAGLD